MDDSNNKNSDPNDKSEESAKELLKSVAIYEAKSAIAKVKLAKLVAVKGVKSLEKNVKKLSAFIDKKANQNKER